jgi:hypothetical protein
MANVSAVLKGTFNLGTDKSVSIINNSTGQPIDIGGRLTSFKADPKIKNITSEPIDNAGFNQMRQAYDGWTGTLEVDRSTGAFDILNATLEANYHNQQPQTYFTIYEKTYNSENGSFTTATYTYCLLELTTSGTFKKDDRVAITIKFEAQQRLVTGS